MTNRIAPDKRKPAWLGPIAASMMAVGCFLLPARAKADEPAPPAKPAAVEAPAAPAAQDAQPVAESEELKAAETRLRQAEVEYLRARIDYEQLKGQNAVATFQQQLKQLILDCRPVRWR